VSGAGAEAGGVEVELRDQSWVLIRPIHADDKEKLLRGFERLSDESRYRRFLTPMPALSSSQLAYLTDIDHRNHEAMIAFDMAMGDAVGVGRYVREADSDMAEAAVTVLDEWQGRGLGTALTRILAGRAEQEGITSFTAVLLADNPRMVSLLRGIGSVDITAREEGMVRVEVPIEGEVTRDPALRSVLRAVASEPLDLASRPGESVPGEQPPDTDERELPGPD
jgi:GNAT superfamily N-acetyltransferase